MISDAEKERLRALEDRIDALKGTQEPAPRQDEHYSMAQHAWRMVTELVAGLGIGFGIGYGLDVALGTTPWLMILFILLGFAAGVNVMIRTAREIQTEQIAHGAKSKKDEEQNGG